MFYNNEQRIASRSFFDTSLFVEVAGNEREVFCCLKHTSARDNTNHELRKEEKYE
jgi:hypothetical protein